jgi:VIT1/CCC1 family predicted Fe2+/Mn2+ transporter
VRWPGSPAWIAGAFSMAAGEWVSVHSQAQMAAGLVGELKRLIGRNRCLVMDELTNQLIEDGFGTDTARKASAELPSMRSAS